MPDFTMPSLGADMEQGTLLEWRVGVGDHVRKGDIVAIIDTEKSTVEVEVFLNGVVEELLVSPGTEVPVGTPLARIRVESATTATVGPAGPAEHLDAPLPPSPPSPAQPAAVEPRQDRKVLSPIVRHLADELGVDTGHLDGTGVGHRVTRSDVEHEAARRMSSGGPGSSPLARRRASELGIDIGAVTGSGEGGAVRERDVSAAAIGSAPQPAATTPAATTPAATTPAAATTAPKAGLERQASIRTAIARLMTKANREIPHYHLSSTVDLHAALDWLGHRNDGRPPAERMLPAALLLRATALSAARHPELNGFWIDDGFRPADGVHLGVAISLRGGGLIAPAIRDADRRSLDDTRVVLRDLVARARQGSLRGSELTGASLTVTNLGDRGAEAVFGVIHPPQVTLVGFGRVVDRPWAVDGLVGVRPTVTATLSADHRATDGHVGSRLLETIDELLQHPADL